MKSIQNLYLDILNGAITYDFLHPGRLRSPGEYWEKKVKQEDKERIKKELKSEHVQHIILRRVFNKGSN